MDSRRIVSRFIDLFAGAGGLTWGLKSTRLLEPIFAVESDEAAARTYGENFGDHVFAGDITLVRRFPRADVVVGGPPCQGFSLLGARRQDDVRNELWREFARAIRSARPRVFVMENVPELLRSAQFQDFAGLARALGYVVEARVLNAADFGAPQKRRRAIVIGRRGTRPIWPRETHWDPKKALGKRKWRTVRNALDGIPVRPDATDLRGRELRASRALHFGRSATAESLERYRTVPAGGNRFDLAALRPDITPRCWLDKDRGSTDIFGRLWWDRPSVTIRTEFFKPEKGRYLHPSAHRPITHYEAALLQGFPRSFVWYGSKLEIARQIGNAVPIRLGHALGLAVARMLAGEVAQEMDLAS
jgi:DNA (cytosine-5)-methyltransferase 1